MGERESVSGLDEAVRSLTARDADVPRYASLPTPVARADGHRAFTVVSLQLIRAVFGTINPNAREMEGWLHLESAGLHIDGVTVHTPRDLMSMTLVGDILPSVQSGDELQEVTLVYRRAGDRPRLVEVQASGRVLWTPPADNPTP